MDAEFEEESKKPGSRVMKSVMWYSSIKTHLNRMLLQKREGALSDGNLPEWVVVLKNASVVHPADLETFQHIVRKHRMHIEFHEDVAAGTFTFFISADKGYLFEQAEERNMIKPLRSGGVAFFRMKDKERFADYDKPDIFFSSHERQKICYEALSKIKVEATEGLFIHSVRLEAGQPLLRKLLETNFISDMFCTHEEAALDKLRFKMVNEGPRELLNHIHEYFGDEIGFYFGWLDFMNVLLLIPALIGAITYFQTWNKLDSSLLLYYPVITSLWGTVFIELWKRKSAVLSYRWGILARKANKSESPDAETPQVEDPSVKSERLWTYAVSYAIVLCATIVPIITTALKIHLSHLYKSDAIVGVIISIFHTLLMRAQSTAYQQLSVKLSQFENHTDDATYRKHMTIRLFLFEIPNRFLGFLYTGFYLQDLSLLRRQLIVFFFVDQIQGTLTEYVIPLMSLKFKWQNALEMEVEEDEDATKKPATATNLSHVPTSKIESNSKLIPYDSTYMDYFEIVLQFALVSSFATAAPIAPLLAYFNNIIEWNGDLYKLVNIHRRPIPYFADGIGVWLQVLEVVSIISVIINAGLSYVYLVNVIQPTDEWSPASYLFAVVIFEHVIFGLKSWAAYAITDIPEWVHKELTLQKARFKSGEKVFTKRNNQLFTSFEDDLLRVLSNLHVLGLSTTPRFHVLISMGFCYFAGYYGFGIIASGLIYTIYKKRQLRCRDKLSREQIAKEQGKLYLNPKMFKDPEGIEWLNYIMDSIWKNYSGNFELMIKNLVNYYLNSYRPAIMKSLELGTCDLGSRAPVLSNMKIVEPPKDRSICLEVDVDTNSKAKLIIVAGMGVNVSLRIDEIMLKGKLRLELKFVDESPYLGLISFQFVGEPELNYSITPLGTTDIMDIQFIAESIRTTIRDLVRFYLVEHSIKIPLANSEVQESGYHLNFTIISADKLPEPELTPTLDPYCKIVVGSKELRTKVVDNSRSPSWNQDFKVGVTMWDNQVYETMQVYIMDSNITTDTVIGVVNVPLKDLNPRRSYEMIYDLKDSYCGQLHLKLCLEPPQKTDPSVALRFRIQSFTDVSPVPKKPCFLKLKMNNNEVATMPTKFTKDNQFDTLHNLFFDTYHPSIGIEFIEAEDNLLGATEITIPELKQSVVHSFVADFNDTMEGRLSGTVQLLTYKDLDVEPLPGKLTLSITGFKNLSIPVSEDFLAGKLQAVKKILPGRGKEALNIWIVVNSELIELSTDKKLQQLNFTVADKNSQFIRVYLGPVGGDIASHFCSLKIPLSGIEAGAVVNDWYTFGSKSHRFERGFPEICLEYAFAASK